ncbi:hypothetical protein Mal64_33930 [Pseudobythopirellula maris]|uniref:TIGR04222 domain-containing membrane protein n=1 Tax=Pseudobythopirellula maris TaxID=2527991 RepID=A0A5C5ZHV6_9BACT|nr:TIGR04222 domain-containing membrane protein [Pseudobythopirellula maris]TWT86567.1 hypothetical protein Mal64_33930 [Pseudobythopirellula maris]
MTRNPPRALLDDDLWRRLEAFRLDEPGAALPMTHRLAQENGWSLDFAERVTREYKRFVYLAMTAGHVVCPSDEVDQAWHLHLTYTHSYWEGLCRGVLGKPLHHNPTRGGADETDKFIGLYNQTLASYRAAFSEAPPEDVWPRAEARFGRREKVLVDRRAAWVVPKPWRVDRGRPLVVAACLIAIGPPLAAGATLNPLDFDGPRFLSFYIPLCLFAAVAAMVCRFALRKPDDPSARLGSEDAETIGALRGRWQGAFHAALAGLMAEEAIEFEKDGAFLQGKTYLVRARRQPLPEDSPLRRSILESTQDRGMNLSHLGPASRPEARRIVERLKDEGLLEAPASYASVRTVCGLLLGSAWLLGVAKLVGGISRDKPVGWLVVSVVVMTIVYALIASMPRQTRTGKRLLKQLQRKREVLKLRAEQKTSGLGAEELALAVGLFGLSACHAPELKQFQRSLSTTAAINGGCSASGCGGDGSDGGGGCGGGCGGCGGD